MASMWKLKSCPRCKGDLFMDRNSDSSYEKCLQCGYHRLMNSIAAMSPDPSIQREMLPLPGVNTPEHRSNSAKRRVGSFVLSLSVADPICSNFVSE